MIAAALLCGCNKEERPQTQLELWRSQADFAILKACTNDLVGITRVVEHGVDDSSDILQKWTGVVVAEHVNSVGGIDRTNLYYKFGSSMGNVFVIEDYERRWAMEKAMRGEK